MPGVETTGEEPQTRRHTEIQMLLAQLGKQLNREVWIPAGDQGSAAQGKRLSEFSMKEFPPLPLGDVARRIIQNIDVVWVKGKSIEAAFEVESTTSIYSGLLRLSDLLVSQPNINVRLFLLAEERRRSEVKKHASRPTFAEMELPERVRFISFERLQSDFESVTKYAESPAILDKISEDLAMEPGEPGGPEKEDKHDGGNGKARVTWEDKLRWADPRVRAELLQTLLDGVKRGIAPRVTTKIVGRWLYIQDDKTFCVLWVKKRGFIVSVAADPSFKDPRLISHPVKGFFFPKGHERRFSFVLDDDLEYALKLIAEGHRVARSPGYPWSRSRRPARP